MFERFTEKAIKVIMLAQEEARRLGHNFVGTEQILLGLIGEGTSITVTCDDGYAEKNTCFKIVTGSGEFDNGYVTVLLDHGSDYVVAKASALYSQGSTVFEQCFS